MFYNHVIKTYPDGTIQHFFYHKCREHEFEIAEKKKKKKDGSSVKRKEIDNNKRAKQMVYDYARSNNFDWFVTLTLDPKLCDRYDYDSCRNELKRFTKYLTEHGFKYLIVPEQHKDGAYHFHGLIQGNLPVVPALNIDSQSEIEGVYWVKDYDSGYTTATKIVSREKTASYLSKYLTKDLQVPKGRKRYWNSSNLNKPVKEYCEELLTDSQVIWFQELADYRKTFVCEFGDIELLEFHCEK